jgi:hypothetical protein
MYIEEDYIRVGDDVTMPDPKDDGTDSWSYGDFIGRVIDIEEIDGIKYATVEDGDGDCFGIELDRLAGTKVED